MSRILLLLAHGIEEHDQLTLLTELGHDCFSIGSYLDPSHPLEDKRPALPQVSHHPELAKLVEADQIAFKGHLPPAIIDWADVIIGHHFVLDWLLGQWGAIRHKRVIWRTVGQSNPALERIMATLRPEGLQIVRYSPKEHSMPYFAGEDALIRFYKDPAEWQGWTGDDAVVGNVTQDMVGRADACGLDFWLAATKGLAAKPAGPKSELIGGVGDLSYEGLKAYLRSIRCMLYTGTRPASYTLGLIEAMMTGVPVVSIGAKAWGNNPVDVGLFEAADIAENWADDPSTARAELAHYLSSQEAAQQDSALMRQRAIDLFGKDQIAQQWAAFLS